MMKRFTLYFLLLCCSVVFGQEVIGFVERAADEKPIPTVHIINLNKVTMSITDKEGRFEIDAEVNDTLYLSYLGYKSIKVRVSNDLIKYPNTRFQLTELALALEEVVVRPYQLTGYLDIDARNVPINRTRRYNIPGLPSGGYEAGNRSPGAAMRVLQAVTNPADFLYNIFGRKPNQLRKLKKVRANNELRDLLAVKYDRKTLEELLQLDRIDIDEILRKCSFSDSFIKGANDLQILEAISGCYEEYKVLNR
ncbi:MAG: Uncharacterised protein [Bacteroidota bacterium]|nr:MAG: Uncharacterised protein [Bacteroidota bacterium]